MKPITKSEYLTYLSCPKAFWLERNRPDLATPPDPAQQRRMAHGQAVEAVARGRFPAGRLIPFSPDWQEMVAHTRQALQDGVPTIFQATFQTAGLLALADVLLRDGDGWRLLEVKGSTSVKEEHLHDLAFQWLVLEGAGISLTGAAIWHLNREYPAGDLFLEAEQTASLETYRAAAEGALPGLQQVAAAPAPPDVPISRRCFRPDRCPFYDHCWQGIQGLTVFHIPRLSEKRLRPLLDAGVLYLHEVPPDAALTDIQWQFVRRHAEKQVTIDRAAIRQALDALQYPLYFLDFETIDFPIPPYEQVRPYQQVPFQYSCHILHSDGRLEHRAFLHTGDDDPRPALVRSLLRDIGAEGHLVAWYANFEAGILRELAAAFPSHAPELNAVADRLWDQMQVFKNFYHHWAFGGSYSLKSVVPVLLPTLDYGDLEIQNGGAAQVAWERMHATPDAAERQRLQEALHRYCARDTGVMVALHQHLQQVCQDA